MLSRSVTGIPFPAVAGIGFCKLAHQSVTEHLGNYRGGCDGEAFAVTLYNGLCRAGQFWQAVAVNQHRGRSNREIAGGPLHGEIGGVEDVHLVDLGDICHADSNQRSPCDLVEQHIPSFRCQLF